MDLIYRFRSRGMSQGWMKDPPALIHPMILIGAGSMLTPAFAQKHNITHVINCAEDAMCPTWFPDQFPNNYVSLNAIDSVDVDIMDWYPEFRETMKKFLQDPHCKRVFVHCQCGINRSTFLSIAYVCDVFRYNYFDARSSILSQRPCAMSNVAFSNQVFQFYQRIK